MKRLDRKLEEGFRRVEKEYSPERELRKYNAKNRIAIYMPDENEAYKIYKFFKENNLKSDLAIIFLNFISRVIDRKLHLDLETDLYVISEKYLRKLGFSAYYVKKVRQYIKPYLMIQGNNVSKKANRYNFDKLLGKTYLMTISGFEPISIIFNTELTEKEFKKEYVKIIETHKVLDKENVKILKDLSKDSIENIKKDKTDKLKVKSLNYISINPKYIDELIQVAKESYNKYKYYEKLYQKDEMDTSVYYIMKSTKRRALKFKRDIKLIDAKNTKKTGKIFYEDNFSDKNKRNYHFLSQLSKETRKILFKDFISMDISNCAPTAIAHLTIAKVGKDVFKRQFPLYHKYAFSRTSFFNDIKKYGEITNKDKNNILKKAFVSINFGKNIVKEISQFETYYSNNYNIFKTNLYETFKEFVNENISITDIFYFLRINKELFKEFQIELKTIRDVLGMNKEQLANYFMSVESFVMNRIQKILNAKGIQNVRIHDEILIEKKYITKDLLKKLVSLLSFKINLKKLGLEDIIVNYNFKYKIVDMATNKVIKVEIKDIKLEKQKEAKNQLKCVEKIAETDIIHKKLNNTELMKSSEIFIIEYF